MSTLVSRAEVRLALPQAVLDALLDHLAEHDAQVSRTSDEGRAELPLGRAVLRARHGRLSLRAEASDIASLAMLKGWIGGRVEGLVAEMLPRVGVGACEGVVWVGDGGDAGGLLPYFREMRVLRTTTLTPRTRRITLAGRDLGRFRRGGLHLRLLLPPAGAPPLWPVSGANGAPVWPSGVGAPAARSYTIRRVDPEHGEIDVEAVLHGNSGGPGARWAERAVPGDLVGVLGPGGGEVPSARRLLLAGDETALPAIARILEGLPAETRVVVRVEVPDEAEQRPLPTRAEIDLAWLPRRPGEVSPLPEAVRMLRWSGGPDSYAWVAGEHGVVAEIRRHWREERGLGRGEQLCAAYWRRGRADGAAS